MTTTRPTAASSRALLALLSLTLFSCEPHLGLDGGVDSGVDGGAPDASVPDWCHHFPVPARLPDGGLDLDSGIFTHFTAVLDAGPRSGMLDTGDIAPLLGCFEMTPVDLDPYDAGFRNPGPAKVYRGCALDPNACPAADAGSTDTWFLSPDATVPFNPRGEDDAGLEPAPSAECFEGLGFSFESGTWAGWTSVGAFGNNPVFGNNVSIDRIKPPGYVSAGAASPLTAVGGDYWEFSRDIGYVGNYWAGSKDVRANWRTAPGVTLSGTLGGTLSSPAFKIASPYVSFLVGGAHKATQRVELVVEGNANNRLILMGTYRGIGAEETPPGGTVNLEPLPNQIVVRASTGVDDGEYLRRRVYWDVQAYQGSLAYFRIVDTAGPDEHVNVDDFRCHKSLPSTVSWLSAPDGGANLVGETVREVPIWGATDTHAHVVSNLTFGGHYIWGDPDDDIGNVYDCNLKLPTLTARDNVTVVRPGIDNPNQYTSCFMSASIIGLMTATGAGICTITASTLAFIPFAGPFLAATVITACSIALTAALTVLSASPTVTTITQHGASMPTSGGIRVGPMLEWLISLFTNKLGPVPGLLELQDWDLPDGSHSGIGLGGSHQRYHKTMIRRAYQGGLRLMVIDALNSRAMQYVLDARDDVDDWTAIKTTVDGVKRLVASDSDPFYKPGPLNDIAEIAYTPGQARDIIRRNKLALILGTEVQELGKARFPGDSAEQQVKELYGLGIRKITAIHGVNNSLGGTGFFNDIYNSAGVFNNLTRDETGGPGGIWRPLLPVSVYLASVLPPPLNNMSLGDYQVFRSLTPDPACSGASCAWNKRNGGWFRVQNAASAPADFIGEQSEITFRVGIEGAKHGRSSREHDPFSSPEFQFSNKLDTLQWLLGVGPGGIVASPRCSLDGMFFPIIGNLDPEAKTNYAASTQHMNDTGLSAQGSEFLTSMMKRGMIVDTDHFGQKTRVDAHALFSSFRAEAGAYSTDEYPILAIHTDVRRYQRHGPYPVDTDGSTPFAATYGFGAETDKTVAELSHIAANGGVVSPGVNGGVVMDPDHLVQGQVRNDCDYTSKSYAVKYLQLVKLMKGRGVTPSTDMNSPSPHLMSRFGNDSACQSGDEPGRAQRHRDVDDGQPIVASWPRDWHPDVAASCRYNSVASPQDPSCPSTWVPQAQLREFSGVEYDDYAARADATTWAPPANASPGSRYIIAQREDELRDDKALATRGVIQAVAYGGGGPLKQRRPVKKFRAAPGATTNRGWDVNIDGMTNEGMLPDVWQDLRNVGVTWEQMGPLFNSAGDFLDMWEKGCRLGAQWNTAHGVSPLAGCD